MEEDKQKSLRVRFFVDSKLADGLSESGDLERVKLEQPVQGANRRVGVVEGTIDQVSTTLHSLAGVVVNLEQSNQNGKGPSHKLHIILPDAQAGTIGKLRGCTVSAQCLENSDEKSVLISGSNKEASEAINALCAKLQDIQHLAAKSPYRPAPNLPQEVIDAMFGRNRSKQTKEHKFWNGQPVPQNESDIQGEQGPIEVKAVKDIQVKPYDLPSGYAWAPCDMNNPAHVEDVYNLLTENYVEDDDNMFRFDYSKDFLQWALKPPGYKPEWHVSVRAKNGKMVGFITGIPVHIRAHDKTVVMAEINFLCVHKKLRSKRLAPVLIKEVTRRVNLCDIWQAVYTAGVVLPRPVARNRYYHRSLNPKKLIDVGFSRLQSRMTLSRTIKLYRLPDTPQTKGIRPMEVKDCPRAVKLLGAYLDKFKLVQTFDKEEFTHWLLTRPGVVYSYVVEDPVTHELTDLVSFYSLPSTIIGNDKYNVLKAAYSFYNVSTKTPWEQLMTDALIFAKNLEFDVFNALNVMENDSFFKELKFGIGDGNLQYYLYNWRCPELAAKDVGIVLL